MDVARDIGMVAAMRRREDSRRSLQPEGGSRSEIVSAHPRAAAMTIAILLHLAMLAALIMSGSIPVVRRPPPPLPTTLTLPPPASDAGDSSAPIPPAGVPGEPTPDLLPPAALPLPSEPALPLPEAEPIDFAALTPRFDAEPDPALTGDAVDPSSGNAIRGGAGGDCPLAASVRQVLEQNVEARTALARIPPPSRSVANAVMLWDGEWIAAERVGGPAALSAVRKAIAEALDRSSAECRARIEPGPVFLIVNGAPETIVLALGSGAWRWSDLLVDVPPNTRKEFRQ